MSAVSQVAPISQISDGQIQATTAPAVSEKSEGQPVVTSQAVSQTSVAQIQATTAGQTSAASSSPTIVPFTGAASRHEYSGLVAAVGALAAFFL
jgi:hypothetical protein